MKRAFTIIELVVIVAIITILVGILIQAMTHKPAPLPPAPHYRIVYYRAGESATYNDAYEIEIIGNVVSFRTADNRVVYVLDGRVEVLKQPTEPTP